MFKRINDKINFAFEVEVARRVGDILTSLKEKANGHKWYSFLFPGQIDYKEFKFLNKGIEIRRSPGTFWPFRVYGMIKLTFSEISPTSTRVKCEVAIGNNLIPVIMAIQTIVLIFWSIGWIMFGWQLDPLTRFGVPVVVVIVVTGLSLFKIMSDRSRLIEYSYTIIRVIKE